MDRAVPIQHREWTFGEVDGVTTGAPYTSKRRTGRGVEIPFGEYTLSSLSLALQFALNGASLTGTFPFAGSGEASGSEYLVTTSGNTLVIRLGDEVINGLDEFAVIPEQNLRRVAFVPGYVADGGPPFNEEAPRSLNGLLSNMGYWDGTTRHSSGEVDYSGTWMSQIEPKA